MSDLVSPGFVALADVAPTIRQDLRYAGDRNFVGGPLDGYDKATCLLAAPAAHALRHAQELLAGTGHSLLVLDGYRPQQAVDHMRRWAVGPEDRRTRARFHPRVPKSRLFGPDYIHTRSGHSRGSTVDVTVVDGDGRALDMGTPFDFFDPLSHTLSRSVPSAARAHRRLLTSVMAEAGFRNLPTEWWHFTLAEEAFPNSYFRLPTTRAALRGPLHA